MTADRNLLGDSGESKFDAILFYLPAMVTFLYLLNTSKYVEQLVVDLKSNEWTTASFDLPPEGSA